MSKMDAYDAYCLQWIAEHLSFRALVDCVQDWHETAEPGEHFLDFLAEHGFNGECFVGFPEFLDNEGAELPA